MISGIIVVILVFIALGIISYLGARYTTKIERPDALIAIYVLFLTCAQFFAAKIAQFDFGIGSWIAPAGVIVFPFTLQITDMVNEKFGRRETYRMILIALASQIIMVFFLIVAGIPTAITEPNSVSGDPLAAFAIVPRITIASWIAFLISENFDAWIYDKIRLYIQEKSSNQWWKFLWIRNVFSDFLSLGLDSLIFVPLAFLGVYTNEILLSVIIGQLAIKWILGIIDTPYMYLTRWIYDNYRD
ncbi:MAG: queuosine precursor transporter [Promethearchaeota archaeon]